MIIRTNIMGPVRPQGVAPRFVGMDLFRPFGVYADGVLVARHPTARAAVGHLDCLRGVARATRVFVGQSSAHS